MTLEMVRYYAERAAEYDQVYERPVWHAEIAALKQRVPGFFAGRRVFEIACGTGYWTEYVAREASRVYATDVNEETLAIARSRAWIRDQVTFQRLDAYTANREGHTFDAGFASFWLSHVDLARMAGFLKAFHSYLEAGAPVLMFDERMSAGRPLATTRTDAAGNRYEMRTLANGERFEIIKNFYDEPRLLALFGHYGRNIVAEECEHFWMLAYQTIG
jgi:SAM-dependent methyltransferase